MKHKKLLSIFLAVTMLLSMLPAAAFGAGQAAEGVEITAFDPISVEAGVAGSAAYEDAAAMIDYLNEHYTSVTAHTYDSGTVSVPVTAWTDTDGYNPAAAGSYTFTAALGEIPAGYTLGEGVTATAEVVVEEADDPGAAYVPGIYSGVGQGYPGNGDPAITVFVQVTADEIVKISAGAHNQTATFFNMAFNGAFGSNSIPKQVIEKQGLDGVDAVSGATLSSNGIKEAIAAALVNAEAGNAAVPDETQTVPAVMWQANSDQPSMMSGMLIPTAEVRRYGSEYTAVIQIGATTIYGIPVNGSDAQNIRTASKTGELTVAPVTEHYDELSTVKTLEVWLNAMKEPLPMRIYVVPMSSDQTVRLKLTFGVEKDKLEATIAAAEVKYADKDLYTEESFAPFEAALNSAKAVFEDENATQEQVDAADTALKNAVQALVFKPRDRTAYTLDELIDYAANAVNGDVIRLGADMSADADAPQSTSKRLIETRADLTIEGQGRTLDGRHKFGFFYVRSGTLTINDIIIKNAEVNPTGANAQAGPSIYVPSSGGNTGNLKLTDSIITGSLALNGGIYVAARNLEMTGCALIGSSARTGSNIYIDKGATGLLENNIIIGSVPVLETTNSDVNFGAAGGNIVLGPNNIIGLIYSGYLPASVDSTSIILGDFQEEDYTPASWTAFKDAWEQASVISDNWNVIRANTDALRAAISALEAAGEEPVPNGQYTLTPVPDETYQAGVTPDGINIMTVNDGFSGLKYFGVQVTPVREHSGNEAVVFTHQRDRAQLSLNVTRADFDAVQEAQAGFNALAGDVINVYIVDDLTNDPDTNPIILQ